MRNYELEATPRPFTRRERLILAIEIITCLAGAVVTVIISYLK